MNTTPASHMDSLNEEIFLELKKLFSSDDAYAWLARPQSVLGMRIPARMVATGEGHAVLEALQGVVRRT